MKPTAACEALNLLFLGLLIMLFEVASGLKSNIFSPLLSLLYLKPLTKLLLSDILWASVNSSGRNEADIPSKLEPDLCITSKFNPCLPNL
jgi:hypothetical protein